MAPLNDDFADAITLSGSFPIARTGDSNVDATEEVDEPLYFPPYDDDATMRATVWYRWDADVTGPIAVSLEGSDYDTVVMIYTGTALTDLVVIAADDDGAPTPPASLATFSATSGTTYWIQVGGYTGATGSIAIGIDYFEPAFGPDDNNDWAIVMDSYRDIDPGIFVPNFYAVASGNGLWLVDHSVYGEGRYLCYSAQDPENWTPVKYTTDIYSPIRHAHFHGGTWVAVGYEDGTGGVAYTAPADASAWTQSSFTLPDDSFVSVTHDGDQWIASTKHGDVYTSTTPDTDWDLVSSMSDEVEDYASGPREWGQVKIIEGDVVVLFRHYYGTEEPYGERVTVLSASSPDGPWTVQHNFGSSIETGYEGEPSYGHWPDEGYYAGNIGTLYTASTLGGTWTLRDAPGFVAFNGASFGCCGNSGSGSFLVVASTLADILDAVPTVSSPPAGYSYAKVSENHPNLLFGDDPDLWVSVAGTGYIVDVDQPVLVWANASGPGAWGIGLT